MSFDQFIAKWDGKLLDYDNAYGGQCVDVYRQYIKEVLGYPQSKPVVGAAQIWDTYLKDYFIRITNTPNGVPKKGDIVIWSKYAGGGYGHVGIFIDGDVYKFNSFDENWPSGSRCHKQPHNYTNVLGWLTPKKKEDNIVTTGPETTTSEIPQTPPSEAVIEPQIEPTPEVTAVETPAGGEEVQPGVPVNTSGGSDSNGSDSSTTVVLRDSSPDIPKPILSLTSLDIFISQTLKAVWNVLVRAFKRF